MSQTVIVGVDIAKHVFHVHGSDETGRQVFSRRLRRSQVAAFFANLPPCLVGMEAGRASHHWARTIKRSGHDVKLMPPRYVKPYVKANKTDALDAEAIAEAVTRPTMRFVAVKSENQQAALMLHRLRQRFVRMRTAQANQARGFMAEFGRPVPQGVHSVLQHIEIIIAEEDVPGDLKEALREIADHVQQLSERIDRLEGRIRRAQQADDVASRLIEIPGVGPLTASAFAASVEDAGSFQSARRFASWLGLTPRQHSSGGKEKLLGISKRGDVYLRTLLIHGARSLLRSNASCPPALRAWTSGLNERRHANVATVALANKMARMIWAVMSKGERYQMI